MVDVRYLIYGLIDKNGSLYEMIVADNDNKALDLFKNVILSFVETLDLKNDEQVLLFKNDLIYSQLALVCSVPVLHVLDEQVLSINKVVSSVGDFIIKNPDLFDWRVVKMCRDILITEEVENNG